MAAHLSKAKLTLLTAAEKEFSERGLHGAKLSTIAAEGQAKSPASINYHFGSRESLFIQTLLFRLPPLMKARSVLDELVASLNMKAPTLESLLCQCLIPQLWLIKQRTPYCYTTRLWSTVRPGDSKSGLLFKADNIDTVRLEMEQALTDCLAKIVGQDVAETRVTPLLVFIDHAAGNIEGDIEKQLLAGTVHIDRVGMLIDDLLVDLVTFLCRASAGPNYPVNTSLVRFLSQELEIEAPEPDWNDSLSISEAHLATAVKRLQDTTLTQNAVFRLGKTPKETTLNATEALIAQGGEDSVTFKLIEETIGSVDDGAVYQFRKKKDLVLAVRDMRTGLINDVRKDFFRLGSQSGDTISVFSSGLWSLFVPAFWVLNDQVPYSNFYRYIFQDTYYPGLITQQLEYNETTPRPFMAPMLKLLEAAEQQVARGDTSDMDLTVALQLWPIIQRCYIAWLARQEETLNELASRSDRATVKDTCLRYTAEACRFAHEGLFSSTIPFDYDALIKLLLKTEAYHPIQ